jgi:hypothetical protein
VSGTTWYDPNSNHFKPVTLWSGSQWHGQYVGVYEPPEVEGRVEAAEPFVGNRIIRDLDRLRQMATSWVRELRLAERAEMSLFAESLPLEPILARVRTNRGWPYYIVPFGTSRLEVRAAMILNAYTGAYEEAIVLPKDCFLRYLTKEKAQALAQEKLAVPPEWLSPPRLIFRPSVETPDRFFPVWRVGLRRDVYVTPRAEAVHRLAETEEELWDRLRRRGKQS